MKTTASMFTGGGLFDVGATWAGYTPIWGVEREDRIAKVARLNGFPVMTADVCEVDYSGLERPDHLHASPPCPNFSVANNDKGERPEDIAMAEAIRRALLALKPDTFTLENVMGYRSSESFKIITQTLSELGYWWDADHLNAADFGVPQTRVRLIVRASRGLLRGYPPPVRWRGWYEAIEDLIPTLPDAEFAPWQMARLPEEYKSFLTGQGTRSMPKEAHEPADTITSNTNQTGIKAFIVGDQEGQIADDNRPAYTVTANERGGTSPRAFILTGAGNTNFADAEPGKGVRYGREPAHTVAAGTGGRIPKAFITDSLNYSSANPNRHADEPIFTQTVYSSKHPAPRAFVGRVVKMTVQALGRFQTVPDTYKGLTVKINGNGFPCLLAQKVLETL
jgi:site-specific DNA-cytosine methylase